MNTKDVLRIMLYPAVLVKRQLSASYVKSLIGGGKIKELADYQYRTRLGKRMNWNNPQTLNEKIQWLKFNSDTSQWSMLSDKYRVREYIHDKGLDHILVGLYGSWTDANDIDWGKLPNRFVMKVNNGSGDVLVCTDKNKIDKEIVTKKYNELLTLKFWELFAEPHYSKIQPCIIAEELLDCNKQSIPSTTLIDYKVWCFGGKPEFIWACYNRTPEKVEVGCYDLDWQYHEEWSVFTSHYAKASKLLPKPQNLKQLIEYAAILSNGFPEVRVDFYEVDGKVYFGEMTFTAKGGYIDFYSDDLQLKLGSKIILPKSMK